MNDLHDDRYVYSPSISFTIIDDKVVIKEHSSGKILRLDKMASEVFLMVDGRNIDEIFAHFESSLRKDERYSLDGFRQLIQRLVERNILAINRQEVS